MKNKTKTCGVCSKNTGRTIQKDIFGSSGTRLIICCHCLQSSIDEISKKIYGKDYENSNLLYFNPFEYLESDYYLSQKVFEDLNYKCWYQESKSA